MRKIRLSDWDKKRLRSFFWYLVTSVSLGLIFFHRKEDLEYFSPPSWIILTIVLIVVCVLVKPYEALRKEKLYNQYSWVFYIYTGLFSAKLVSAGITLFWDYESYENTDLLWGAGILFAGAVIYELIPSIKIDEDYQRFAAGAVGSNQDELNFLTSAKNAANGLLKLPHNLNVVALHGGLGEGKSSYARMIIESFEKKQLLYTYISLTETNEAKDLSKLFEERWLETLQERYPKINVSSLLPSMQSILRENGQSLLNEILNIFSILNVPLLKTSSRAENTKKMGKKVSEGIAQLFGGIPEIQEDLWIILLDEVERAQLDEIYRLIEIIERFKNEAERSFPIKIVFLLCLSKPDLEKFLDKFTDKLPTAYLVKNFFFDDPKSITENLFLPPVDPKNKSKLILKHLKELENKYQLNELKDVRS